MANTDKNQQIFEFWEKYLSKESKVVRWDTFEENLLCYIENNIELNHTILRRVNWEKFLIYLKDKISEKFTVSEVYPEVPQSPIHHQLSAYKGFVVSREMWTNYLGKKGLNESITKALEDYTKFIEKDKGVLTGDFDKINPLHTIFLRRTDDSNIYKYACGAWYKGLWKNGKRNGKGKLVLSTGDYYEGDFVDGKRSGQGTMFYKEPISNVLYKGEWMNDTRHGFGVLEYPDGSIFQGKWENGVQVYGLHIWPNVGQYTGFWHGYEMDGEGSYKSLDGETMTGEWKNSKLHGKGERRTSSGEIYAGEWFEGKLNGKGVFQSTDVKYTGDFVDNLEHGYGLKLWKDGALYEGQWSKGQPHGKGKLKMPTGEEYNGDFLQGKKTGNGTKVFENGDKYEGQWKDDLMEGYGVMTFNIPSTNGFTKKPYYTGEWQAGKQHGIGTMVYPDGSKYEGSLQNGMRHGEGTFTRSWKTDDRGFPVDQSEKYVGGFKDNYFHGFGLYTSTSGAYYKGSWVKGKKHGKGEYKNDVGRVLIGLFNEDQLINANVNNHINQKTIIIQISFFFCKIKISILNFFLQKMFARIHLNMESLDLMLIILFLNLFSKHLLTILFHEAG